MELLTDNFIANMYGLNFLILYLVTILAALMLAKNFIRNADTSDQDRAQLLPSKPDPCELAYLRGGVSEVIRLTIFRLVQSGRLILANARKGMISRAEGPSHSSAMSDMERTVYNDLANPKTMSGIIQGLSSEFIKHCDPLEWHLKERHLLAEQAVIDRVRHVRMSLLAVIVGLGGYKLTIALSRGRTNVLFLIVLAVVGCILTMWKLKTPRLSRRGEDYLKQLQTDLEDKKNAIGEDSEIEGSDLTFFVALFGFGMLVGTQYSGYADILSPPLSSFGDSSGSNDSGGGCSGGGSSDSGGGCGGCGGGGD